MRRVRTSSAGASIVVLALFLLVGGFVLAYGPAASGVITPTAESGWTFDPGSGRWEKGYREFRRDDMTDKQRERGDKPSSSGTPKTEFERGCVGVTNALAGFPSEDLSDSDCYLKEADALARAQNKECQAGKKPQIYGVRYWDTKKDQRTVGPDGRYPTDMGELYRARPGYTNYDFGYRQADGSYVHANHTTPGMKVKISPSSKEFDSGYAGFNTVLYCVRCGIDDAAGTDDQGSGGDEDADDQDHGASGGEQPREEQPSDGGSPPGEDQEREHAG